MALEVNVKLKEVMVALGIAPAHFAKEWKRLTKEDQEELKFLVAKERG